MLGEQVKAQEEKLEAVIAGIKPMLDCVGFELPECQDPNIWVC